MISLDKWLAVNGHYKNVLDCSYLARSHSFTDPEFSFLIPWVNLLSSSSEGVLPCAWCEECCEQIADLSKGIVTCDVGHDDRYHFNIQHRDCFKWCQEELRDQSQIVVKLSELQNSVSPIKKFIRECAKLGIPEEDTENVARHLHVLGFVNKTKNAIKSWVYLVQAGNEGPIKIGYTEKSVQGRIHNLQTGCPEPISLLAAIPGPRALETELHERFRAHRKQGEWFNPHHELLSFIESEVLG